MTHSTNKYADIMLDRISQCISEETKNLPALSGAKVSSVNSDGTINIYFPPDDNKIFTNISNQTPFNLQEGDSVELLLKDGSYNNCWIVAKHQDTFNGSFDLAEDMSNFATKEDLQNMQAALLTETDPIFASSPAHSITQQDIARWNDAVVVIPTSTTPKMNSAVGAVGSENAYARGDHVHPTDTSRAPLASPALTGVPTAPTADVGTNTTQIATTAFVKTALDNKSAPVTSVNNKTGVVVLTASDVGALPDSTTIPQGTVTSVRIQATSPVQSSTNTAQSTTLNTTISLADSYGDTKNPYAAKAKNTVLAGPSTGTATAPSFRTLEADDIPSLTVSKISDFPSTMTPSRHSHGYISNDGKVLSQSIIGNGDRLVITDSNDSDKIATSSITFGTSTTTFLSNKGTWATPTGAVTSVNSKSGAVTLTASDVSALPDDTDVTKWNGVTLNKTNHSSAGNFSLPVLSSNSATEAKLVVATATPSANAVAKYNASKYLNSTTPAANDNSTKVATTAYVDSAISNLGSILNYKGTKATESALPSTGNVTGDVWIVSADNSEYVWNGTAWEKLGLTIDLSGYVPTTRTVNGKALSTDISLDASDVGALPDSTDVTKWNGVSLVKDYTSNSGNISIPYITTSGSDTARLIIASNLPNTNGIAKYDDVGPYLSSTTPSANDNSTKVATTAFVQNAIGAAIAASY